MDIRRLPHVIGLCRFAASAGLLAVTLGLLGRSSGASTLLAVALLPVVVAMSLTCRGIDRRTLRPSTGHGARVASPAAVFLAAHPTATNASARTRVSAAPVWTPTGAVPATLPFLVTSGQR